VITVGQNEVTPCSNIPLATLSKPSSKFSTLVEKSTSNPPVLRICQISSSSN